MKILISGYYGFANFGDEAILGVLTQHLKERGYELTVLSANPKQTAIDFGVNTFYSFSLFNLPELIKKSDVLISGGGSLLQDVTSKKSILYYMMLIFLAKLFGKKVVIFAQGIGPVKTGFIRFLLKKLLAYCDYISVRDENSKYLLDSWNIPAKLLCDPIFSINLPQYNPNGSVAVQLRSFDKLSDEFLVMLAHHILKNYSDKKISLISFQDMLDLPVLEKFHKILLSINPACNVKILSGLTNIEIINKMSEFEIVYAMRFHALVLALKYGIRCVAINYDIKVKTLAQKVKIPCINLYDEQINISELVPVVYFDNFNWSEIDTKLSEF